MVFHLVKTLTESVTLALDQQTVGSVLPVSAVVYVWHGDCRLSTGIAASKYQLSEFLTQLYTQGKTVTLWRGMTK